MSKIPLVLAVIVFTFYACGKSSIETPASTPSFSNMRVERTGTLVRWKIPYSNLKYRYKKRVFWTMITDFHRRYEAQRQKLVEAAIKQGKFERKIAEALPQLSYEDFDKLILSVISQNEPKHFAYDQSTHEPTVKSGRTNRFSHAKFYQPNNPAAHIFFVRASLPIPHKPELDFFVTIMGVFQPYLVVEFDVDRNELPKDDSAWDLIDRLPEDQISEEIASAVLIAPDVSVRASKALTNQTASSDRTSPWGIGYGRVYGPLNHPRDLIGMAMGFGGDGALFPWLNNVITQKLEGAGSTVQLLIKPRFGWPLLIPTASLSFNIEKEWEVLASGQLILPLDKFLEVIGATITKKLEQVGRVDELERLEIKYKEQLKHLNREQQ